MNGRDRLLINVLRLIRTPSGVAPLSLSADVNSHTVRRSASIESALLEAALVTAVRSRSQSSAEDVPRSGIEARFSGITTLRVPNTASPEAPRLSFVGTDSGCAGLVEEFPRQRESFTRIGCLLQQCCKKPLHSGGYAAVGRRCANLLHINALRSAIRLSCESQVGCTLMPRSYQPRQNPPDLTGLTPTSPSPQPVTGGRTS